MTDKTKYAVRLERHIQGNAFAFVVTLSEKVMASSWSGAIRAARAAGYKTLTKFGIPRLHLDENGNMVWIVYVHAPQTTENA